MESEAELFERMDCLGELLSQDVDARDVRGAKEASDWRPLWQAIADAGVLGLVIPREYGGMGLDTLTAVRAIHRLGEACRDNGMLLAINGQLWAMQMSFWQFGSEEQRRQWLPGLIDGSVVCCHAVTEAASGSDAMSLRTRAERTEDGYRLSSEQMRFDLATRIGRTETPVKIEGPMGELTADKMEAQFDKDLVATFSGGVKITIKRLVEPKN